MQEISFERTAAEDAAILAIIDRAGEMGLIRPFDDRVSIMMDLAATHANGTPMDFDRMLAADDFNFAHDYCGIARHLDRRTGRLGGMFLPRFARKESVHAEP